MANQCDARLFLFLLTIMFVGASGCNDTEPNGFHMLETSFCDWPIPVNMVKGQEIEGSYSYYVPYEDPASFVFQRIDISQTPEGFREGEGGDLGEVKIELLSSDSGMKFYKTTPLSPRLSAVGEGIMFSVDLDGTLLTIFGFTRDELRSMISLCIASKKSKKLE